MLINNLMKSRKVKMLFLSAASAVLVACGGGGSGPSPAGNNGSGVVTSSSVSCVQGVNCVLTVLGWSPANGTASDTGVQYTIYDETTGQKISAANGTGLVTENGSGGFIAGNASGETQGTSVILGPASHKYYISLGANGGQTYLN